MWPDQGLKARDYEKLGDNLIMFDFKCTHFAIAHSLAIAPLNITPRLPTSFGHPL
jgi:hypothetical protein